MQSHVKKPNNWMVFVTLIKGFATVSILLIPNGFYHGGWLFSSVVLIFSMILHIICLNLLLESSDKVGGSLSDVGAEVFGIFGKAAWDILIAISQAGFSIPQIVFILQNI